MRPDQYIEQIRRTCAEHGIDDMADELAADGHGVAGQTLAVVLADLSRAGLTGDGLRRAVRDHPSIAGQMTRARGRPAEPTAPTPTQPTAFPDDGWDKAFAAAAPPRAEPGQGAEAAHAESWAEAFKKAGAS